MVGAVHIFNMWTIIQQSLNEKELKLLELQITQTWYLKVMPMEKISKFNTPQKWNVQKIEGAQLQILNNH